MFEADSRIDISKVLSKEGNSMAQMHAHGFHELYFLISGKRRYFIGHTIYDVSPGNLVVIPKTELHRTDGKRYDRYLISFYEESVLPLIAAIGRERFDGLMQSGCLQFSREIAQELQQDIEKAMCELSEQKDGYRVYISHLLQGILLTALRHGKRKEPMSGESADKIQEVARYISENYGEDITLRDAAELAYMEKTYFSKRFKKLTGFGFHEYLTKTRIRAAEKLLRESKLSVGSIAGKCGFGSSNYFGDVFRRENGMSPTEYRKKAVL